MVEQQLTMKYFVNGGYVASADSRLISTLGSEMKVSGEVD